MNVKREIEKELEREFKKSKILDTILATSNIIKEQKINIRKDETNPFVVEYHKLWNEYYSI